MNQPIEEKNKELVLKAFDTLFNKRDYAAAERYWSPNYIRHSAHIEPGREGYWWFDHATRLEEGGSFDWSACKSPNAIPKMQYASRIQTQRRDTYQ